MNIIPNAWKFRAVDPATHGGERDTARRWWVFTVVYFIMPLESVKDFVVGYWPVPLALAATLGIGFLLGRWVK